MAISLFPHNQEAYNAAAHMLQEAGKAAVIHPTGTGKSFIAFIKFHYPILQKHHWLTPVYEVRRWIKLIFTSDAKRSLRTLKTNAEISAEVISSTADLLKNLGL